jgi:hypothetical protein
MAFMAIHNLNLSFEGLNALNNASLGIEAL